MFDYNDSHFIKNRLYTTVKDLEYSNKEKIKFVEENNNLKVELKKIKLEQRKNMTLFKEIFSKSQNLKNTTNENLDPNNFKSKNDYLNAFNKKFLNDKIREYSLNNKISSYKDALYTKINENKIKDEIIREIKDSKSNGKIDFLNNKINHLNEDLESKIKHIDELEKYTINFNEKYQKTNSELNEIKKILKKIKYDYEVVESKNINLEEKNQMLINENESLKSKIDKANKKIKYLQHKEVQDLIKSSNEIKYSKSENTMKLSAKYKINIKGKNESIKIDSKTKFENLIECNTNKFSIFKNEIFVNKKEIRIIQFQVESFTLNLMDNSFIFNEKIEEKKDKNTKKIGFNSHKTVNEKNKRIIGDLSNDNSDFNKFHSYQMQNNNNNSHIKYGEYTSDSINNSDKTKKISDKINNLNDNNESYNKDNKDNNENNENNSKLNEYKSINIKQKSQELDDKSHKTSIIHSKPNISISDINKNDSFNNRRDSEKELANKVLEINKENSYNNKVNKSLSKISTSNHIIALNIDNDDIDKNIENINYNESFINECQDGFNKDTIKIENNIISVKDDANRSIIINSDKIENKFIIDNDEDIITKEDNEIYKNNDYNDHYEYASIKLICKKFIQSIFDSV